MRLTMRSGGTAYWKTGENAGYRPDDVCFQSEVERLDKLAAYEDTGLSPEEFRERTESVLELYGKLKPYADAKEQGRLLILPCKVGDTLYAPTRNFVSEFRVCQFDFGGYEKPYLWVEWYLTKGITGNFRIDGIGASEIGKTVFLTREEAEAALKGGRDDGT